MSDSKIYLDHNATSPLLPEVENVMSEVAQQTFANPSSPHWAGRNARFLLEEAREIQRRINNGEELYNLTLTIEQLKMLKENKEER